MFMKGVIFVVIFCCLLQLGALCKVRTDTVYMQMPGEMEGSVRFADTQQALRQEDYQTTCVLRPKSNLYMMVELMRPVTYYHRLLAPQLSDQEIFKKGNFQFSFFVDGQMVYRSNLSPGAPSQDMQNREVRYSRPLIDQIHGQGTWSEWLWTRFLYNGGEQALTEGQHLLRLEVRPYIQLDKLLVGDLIASGELRLEVRLKPIIDAERYSLRTPMPYSGLSVSTAPFDHGKIQELKGMIEEGVFKKINSIVVLKQGKLLIEEYFNGENRDSLHDPRSVGKTFASSLMGIAIADRFIQNEFEPLAKFYEFSQYPNFHSGKRSTTLQELLTMSSGFDGDDGDPSSPGNEENMYPTNNWVEFALKLPYRDSLRRKWHYFTAGVVLLGDVINKSVPGGMERYAHEKLFAPLEISRYRWEYTPQGLPNTAGGIRMNALDFAKFGQLYKNGGVWNGRRVLPKQWVQKSLSKQVLIPGREIQYYGYLFWNKVFKIRKKGYEAYYCAGNGGNYIIIMDDIPYVIVMTASAYGQPYAHTQVGRIMNEYLLPALLHTGQNEPD